MIRRHQPNDNLIRVSPSQIKVKRRCDRKWAFKYINRLTEPTSVKQQFGTDGHGHLETWIREGKRPPSTETGNAAKQLIRGDFIPPPSPELARWVEKAVKIPLPHIHPRAVLIGYSDLIVPPTLVDPVIVADYKFTSSLRWAMTEADAEADPQSLIYARYGMDEFGIDEAIVRFLYATASNPKTGPRQPTGAKKVEVRFKRGEDPFELGWAEIEKDVAGIVHAKLNWKSANADAGFNAAACGDFGGCPFADVCIKPVGAAIASVAAHAERPNLELSHRDDDGMVASLTASLNANQKTKTKETTVSLLDKIRAAARGEAPAEPPAQAEAQPAEAPGQQSLLDRLQKHSQKEGVNPPPPQVEPASEPVAEASGADSTLTRQAELEGMGVKELKVEAKLLKVKGYSTMPKAALVAALLAGPAAPMIEVTGTGGPVTETPSSTPHVAGGGPRQDSSSNFQDWHDRDAGGCQARFDDVKQTCANSQCSWEPQLGSVTIKEPAPNGAGLMVLLDCVPRKGMGEGKAVMNLADWVKDVTAKVAVDNKVPHWGFIDYKSGAVLSAALEASFQESPPTGCVIVDSYSLEGRALKDVLIRYADIVVQGVR